MDIWEEAKASWAAAPIPPAPAPPARYRAGSRDAAGWISGLHFGEHELARDICYLPFGEDQVQLGTVQNTLRFPGQYYDAETGLHYNWNMCYTLETGRYLVPDPFGLECGLNLYAYVENDPLNWRDPEELI